MKKILTGVLATLAFGACFTGCLLDEEDPNAANADVAAAADYLEVLYSEDATVGRKDFERITSLTYPVGSGINYTVTWSVDVAEEHVKIDTISGDNTKILVNVNENSTADVPYVLTATVSYGDKSDTATFNYTLSKAPSYVASPITAAPEVGEEYVLYMYQTVNKEDRYFSGLIGATYYLATETDYEKAVTVKVEAVPDKADTYYMVFNDIDTGAKQYIGVKNNFSGGWRFNAIFQGDTSLPTGASAVSFEWVFDSQYEIMKTTIVDAKFGKNETPDETKTTDCYLGTYKQNWTIGSSDWSYLTGESAATNSYAKLAKLVDKSTTTDADKLAAEKLALAVPSEVIGDNEVELPTTPSTYNDVTITWEKVSGDSATLTDNKLTFTNPAADTEVVVKATLTCGDETPVEVSFTITHKNQATNPVLGTSAYKFFLTQGNKNNAKYYLDGGVSGRYLTTTQDASAAVSVYAELVETSYKFYILDTDGTTKKYVTIYLNDSNQVSVKYDAEGTCAFDYNDESRCWYTTVGEKDYYLGTYKTFETVSASETSFIDAEKADVSQFPLHLIDATATLPVLTKDAYKMFLTQVNLESKKLYLNGEVSGRYLSMTETAADGVDVYAEAYGAGYKFYILGADNAKQYVTIYMNDNNKESVKYDAEGTCVYSYNAERKCWYTVVNDTEYYLGTYSTYNTVSASKTSYITAANTGVSQFPVALVLTSEVAPEGEGESGGEGEGEGNENDTPAATPTLTWTPSALGDGKTADNSEPLSGNYTDGVIALDSNIALTAEVGTNSNGNTPAYNKNAGQIRMYAGNTFTFAALNGKKITSIVLTVDTSKKTFTLSSTDAAINATSASVTITPNADATEIKLNVANNSGDQVQIVKIEVFYE